MSKLIRGWLLQPVVDQLHQLQRTVVMNQQELLDRLNAADTAIVKIGAETTALLQAIANMQAAIDAAGNTTPEVDAALAALLAHAQAVDELVPDAAP